MEAIAKKTSTTVTVGHGHGTNIRLTFILRPSFLKKGPHQIALEHGVGRCYATKGIGVTTDSGVGGLVVVRRRSQATALSPP
jgi:hypothetical protein